MTVNLQQAAAARHAARAKLVACCRSAYRRRGYVRMRLEILWSLVRLWAASHGHAYVSTYGIVGVAPT